MNENYIYSARDNAFYSIELKINYDLAGTWPKDGVIVSDDVFNEYSGLPPDDKIRWSNDDGMPCWIDIPPLTHDELVQIAENEKQHLLFTAQQTISIWQTKLQLSRITDDEKRQLNLWLDYIDAVNAIDTSTAPDIQWPIPPKVSAR